MIGAILVGQFLGQRVLGDEDGAGQRGYLGALFSISSRRSNLHNVRNLRFYGSSGRTTYVVVVAVSLDSELEHIPRAFEGVHGLLVGHGPRVLPPHLGEEVAPPQHVVRGAAHQDPDDSEGESHVTPPLKTEPPGLVMAVPLEF